MRTSQLKVNGIIIATIFAIVVGGIAVFINNTYDNWAEEVIQTNKILSEFVVNQLKNSSSEIMLQLDAESYFDNESRSMSKVNEVDNLLSEITSHTLSSANGMEGGFYIKAVERFQGYAYPTSPPPKPVYGPPPRSFNIIKEQTVRTINSDTLIVDLHQFDPAIFPLATIPIVVGNKVVGAAWARIHIERELPTFKWMDILNIAAILSLLGFIFTLSISFKLHNRVETINSDLEQLEIDPSHRVENLPGMFGFISKSINKMVDSLQSEHEQREQLEHELHQKDKMASLGKLIAGVAHEVKTPLAIIKTRIQMWQQKLKVTPQNDEATEIITDDSLNLVINEINRLSNLVNRLLIFSKPIDDNFKKTNINSLIKDILTLFKSDRYKSKAEIIFRPTEDLKQVKIDPNKIEQVILNIITNSFESIDENGEIIISTFAENEKAVISISDNGTGIPNEVKDNIFDPFFTTKDNGTGLGLSIAYEIIKAHKGTIEYQSNEIKGSIFKIIIPFKQTSDDKNEK